jgi:hypothetical protein
MIAWCCRKPQAPGEMDPAYADHPIPDDLDW